MRHRASPRPGTVSNPTLHTHISGADRQAAGSPDFRFCCAIGEKLLHLNNALLALEPDAVVIEPAGILLTTQVVFTKYIVQCYHARLGRQ